MFAPSFTKAKIVAPRVLASSGVAVSHTGNTDETALLTLSIPAGSMGANGWLRVHSQWSFTNANGTRTPRVRLGGVSGSVFFGTAHASTINTFSDVRWIHNRNAANSQVGHSATAASSTAASSGTIFTAAVDTSAAQDLVLSGQLANGSDTITLESYIVELFYKV